MFSFINFSDKNRFVSGSRNGHITVWTNFVPNSKKIFKNTEQENNATFVKYANNKIYAIAELDSLLTIMDLELNTLEVIDHKFKDKISILTATDKYVSVGDWNNVTVFDQNYYLVLVSSN